MRYPVMTSTSSPSIRTSVIDLWGQGHTVVEIARRVGVTSGVVSGLVHRMRLREDRELVARRKYARACIETAEHTGAPVKPRAPSLAWVPLVGVQPIQLADMPKRGRCRWPVTGGSCGASCEDRSYCPTHYAMAYMPVPKRIRP